MLVYSGKRSDQNGCAARVHYHRLGIMADKDRDDSATIEAKIERVLESAELRESLEQMYKHYTSYRESKVLATYVKDVLETQQEQSAIPSAG